MTVSKIHSVALSLALLAGAPKAIATDLPDPYPRDGAVKVLDNDRLVVWNTTWRLGVPTPVHEHRMDQLSVTVEPGSVKVINPDGKSSVGEAVSGTVRFLRAGTVHQEEGTSEKPRRAFMLEFKPADGRTTSVGDIAGLFTPGRATRVLDNDRAQVWDVTLDKGMEWAAAIACCDVVSVVVEALGAPAAKSPGYTRAGGPLSVKADRGNVRVVLVLLK